MAASIKLQLIRLVVCDIKVIINNLKMLTPAYDYNLGHPVSKGLVTIGKCKNLPTLVICFISVDGNYPSMAIALQGGKVLIH